LLRRPTRTEKPPQPARAAAKACHHGRAHLRSAGHGRYAPNV